MIFDWLFKRSKKSNNKEAVAPVFIDVPTREDLIKNNQTEMIKLLDQYKKEYKDKLKERLLFSDISSADLSKKYLENQDIIIKHIMSNNYTGIDEILASGSIEELLEAKLEYLKLYILNEKNNKIHNEILLRYMALTEIKEKAYFIRPTQRRAISNELDFLHNSLVVCKSNNFATNTDCKLYLIRMNEINRYMNKLSNDENKLLNERKRLVTKLANTFIKDKYDSILSSNMSDLGIVSYLEIELEKYYLSHKEDFELCKLEILPKPTISDKEDTKQLLKQIEELEAKYLLLNMFNKLDEYVFIRLYETKFKILTRDINCFGESVISKEDFGYKYYKNIVEEKINLLLSGNNQNFNDTFANLNGQAYAIREYFISAYETLNNMEKLSVLLSFAEENGFNDLLNNMLINRDNLNIILLLGYNNYFEYYENFFQGRNHYGIEWNKYIPLKSILEIMRRKESCMQYKPLTRLYNYSDLVYPLNQLPDGIIKLVPVDVCYHLEWFNILPVCYPPTSIEIELPKTIKEYSNYKLLHYYIKKLPFGIKKVAFDIDQNIPPIPPTVNEILLLSRTMNESKPFVLTFLDFKNSDFLRKRANFINLINKLRLAGVTRIIIRFEETEKATTIIEMCNLNTNTVVIENGSLTSYFNGGPKYEAFLNEIYYKKIRRKLNRDGDNEKKEDKQKIKKKIC